MATRESSNARAIQRRPSSPEPASMAAEALDALAAALAPHLVQHLAELSTGGVGRALMNAEQAGALLGVPATWVLAEARARRIPHVRLGHYVRFEAGELEQWWRERARGPRRGPI